MELSVHVVLEAAENAPLIHKPVDCCLIADIKRLEIAQQRGHVLLDTLVFSFLKKLIALKDSPRNRDDPVAFYNPVLSLLPPTSIPPGRHPLELIASH